MATFNSEQYKDERPARTIARIRRILEDLGLLMVEIWSESAGLHSVRITVLGTSVGQNGKGVTQELALASAYGEVMERLQNRNMYSYLNLAPEALTHGGFYIAPDERPLTLDEVLASDHEFVRSMIDAKLGEDSEDREGGAPADLRQAPEPGDGGRRRTAGRWSEAGQIPGCGGDFLGIPYYDVNRDALVAIPYPMVQLMCGSNGACAGNTPEEAILQGLFEILERHAMKRIVLDGMTPPTIPREYVSRFEAVDAIIGRLEGEFGYSLTVKDCSLGWGLPVVGVIAADRNRSACAVKMGAHVSFEIALERCLTELFQGREAGSSFDRDLTMFDPDDRQAEAAHNWISLIRTGQGSHPRTFFSGTPAYSFREFPDDWGADNRQRLKRVAGLLAGKGFSLLVRDVSFLGFPAYQVLVPGLSEMFMPVGAYCFELFMAMREVAATMRDLNGASERGLRKTAFYLSERLGWAKEADNLPRLLGFPVNRRFPWHNIHPRAFLAALQWRLGQAAEAYGTMARFVEYLERKAPGEEVVFYRCVRDLLGVSAKGGNRRDAAAILATFYPEDVLRRVMEKWGDADRVLDKFTALPCFRCPGCRMKDGCSQPLFRDLDIRLRDKMRQNPVDQEKLRLIFRETPDNPVPL